MKVYKYSFTYDANCYLVVSDEKNAVVIDPSNAADKVIEIAKKEGLTVKKILATHGHFDHILTLCELAEKTNAPIYIHKDDGKMLEDTKESLADLVGKTHPTTKDYNTLEDGDIVELDELKIKVLSTPGHTPGSVCFIVEDKIFSGDTLFKDSIGRTDFPNGSYPQIINSLRKLKSLEGEYVVCCGHGDDTTLSREKLANPYMSKV